MHRRSKFGKEITEAQHLAETICVRQAKVIHKLDLLDGFWLKGEWKRKFQDQILLANSLLNLYSYEDVWAALQSQNGRFVCTLRNPKLDDAIKDTIQNRLNRVKIAEQKILTQNDPTSCPSSHQPTSQTTPTQSPSGLKQEDDGLDFYDRIMGTKPPTKKKTVRAKLDG